MAIQRVLWNDDLHGNVSHIAEHGLMQEDVEDVLFGVHELDVSRSSGLPIAFGFTTAGEYLCVVFEQIDEETVYPVTAFVLED